MQWIDVNGHGFVVRERVVAVGSAESAPLRRLIGATALTHIVDLTGGEKRRTVLMLDSGHVVLTAVSLREWMTLG